MTGAAEGAAVVVVAAVGAEADMGGDGIEPPQAWAGRDLTGHSTAQTATAPGPDTTRPPLRRGGTGVGCEAQMRHEAAIIT